MPNYFSVTEGTKPDQRKIMGPGAEIESLRKAFVKKGIKCTACHTHESPESGANNPSAIAAYFLADDVSQQTVMKIVEAWVMHIDP